MSSSTALNETSQGQLIRLAVDDANQEAIDWLLGHHRSRLIRLVMRWTRNHHDAEDISQIVFSKVHQALPEFETDRTDHSLDADSGSEDTSLERRFSVWLDRIAFRCTIDYIRRDKKFQTVQVDSVDTGLKLNDAAGFSEHDYKEANRLFRFAKDHLNAKQYAALYFCYVDGMTTAEIAAEMQSSSIAIRALLFRSRRKLKSAMQKHGFDHG